MLPWYRSRQDEAISENIDVKENGSIRKDVDAGIEGVEDPNVDDGIFVTETGRKPRSFATKAITCVTFAAIFAGTAAMGYGVSMAVRHSRISQATAGVDEEPQVDTSTAGVDEEPQVDTSYLEEDMVTPISSPEPNPESMPESTPKPTEAIVDEATEIADVSVDFYDFDQSMSMSPVNTAMTNEASKSGKGSKAAKSKAAKFMFTNNTEVRTAIQEYLDEGCTTDMTCSAILTYGEIADWDVSRVQDFSHLFEDEDYCQLPGADTFNEPIGNWDTGSATNMESMFSQAQGFNQPLNYDTSKVEDMNSMFYYALAFNQPISFNVKKVTSLNAMFDVAETFNQQVNFVPPTGVDLRRMFNGAEAFNQDLCHFGVNWPYRVSNMFDRSNCADQNQPTDSSGPWCAVTTCPF